MSPVPTGLLRCKSAEHHVAQLIATKPKHIVSARDHAMILASFFAGTFRSFASYPGRCKWLGEAAQKQLTFEQCDALEETWQTKTNTWHVSCLQNTYFYKMSRTKNSRLMRRSKKTGRTPECAEEPHFERVMSEQAVEGSAYERRLKVNRSDDGECCELQCNSPVLQQVNDVLKPAAQCYWSQMSKHHEKAKQFTKAT